MRYRRRYGRRPVNRGLLSGNSRRIFNIMAWTASFLMVLTMLPEESPAMQTLSQIEDSIPIISIDLTELKAGPEDSSNSEKLVSADGFLGDKVRSENNVSGEIPVILSDGNEGEKGLSDSEIKSQSDTDLSEKSSGIVLTGETKKTSTTGEAAILKNNTVVTTKTSDVTGSGNIIIYHTHATEAYMPVAATSTHIVDEAGTVREAGRNLTNALKQKGFSVVHDKTLHDSPSYNKSYNRSLETSKKLVSQYGDLQLLIDFHRDAASSVGGKAKTVNIDGQTVASFALVVGTKNNNYNEIRSFAEKIKNKANSMYPGFCTGIIEKPYKFNGYISDRYILLELGNNANTIQQVNTSTIYLADVFANVLSEM